MAGLDRGTIRNLVREVLEEMSGGARPPSRPPAPRGPRALIVFQAGIRRLEEALQQLPLLEARAAWSGVYTVPAVRSRVCGADVRGQGGAPCILDTVKPEGLEKVLARADVLVLPTLCFQVANRVAHLLTDDPDAHLVFSALAQGKRVLAARDGFMVYETLANTALKAEIDSVLKKLEGFGVVFCPTRELAETFGRITGDLVPQPRTAR
ncbi:MAG: hypothetical protein HY892_02560 [Deltaproteobacteria bacterium]|nr:hypothetical protein [Deltaproteobacteria bacterium]